MYRLNSGTFLWANSRILLLPAGRVLGPCSSSPAVASWEASFRADILDYTTNTDGIA